MVKNDLIKADSNHGSGTLISVLFLISFLFLFSLSAHASEKTETPQNLTPVTLQLSWTHGYQFAGYYAAKSLGFYEDAGLDVTILPRGESGSFVQTVLNGDADFGIWSPELLVIRADGETVQILAAIFQHHPMVVLTRMASGIESPQDLIGKKVFFQPHGKAVQLDAMLLSEGVNFDELVHVDPTDFTGDPIDNLMAGKVDAVALYLFDIPKEYMPYRKFFNVMRPSTYGVDFYGDLLFTTERFSAVNTDVVRKFKEASIQGWQFALAHRKLTAEAVQKEFFPDSTPENLLALTDQLEELVLSNIIEVGRINRGRLLSIQDTYQRLGLINGEVNLDDFIFDSTRSNAPKQPINDFIYPLAFLVVAGIAALSYCRNQRLKAVKRARDLISMNEELNSQMRQKEAIAEKLQNSHILLKQGLDGMGATLWAWILASDELQVSKQLLDEMGYSKENVVNKAKDTIALIHPEDRQNVRDSFREMAKNKAEVVDLEFRLLHHNGNFLWVQSRAYATRDENGNIIRIVGSLINITDRLEAEDERDRLFNLSIDLMAVSGFDGFLQQVNPAWVRLLGWSRDELMSHPILFFVHPSDQSIAAEAMDHIASGSPVEDLEFRFRCRDGSYRWLSWSSFPYKDKQLIFSVVRDVTENKQSENQLLNYQTRLRNLSNQMSLIEDRQRRQLAEAIHDGLAQQLFAIRAQVVLLKYPDKVLDYAELVKGILEILDESMRDTRNLSFELFPPVLYEVGLDAALSWLSHNFSNRTKIPCAITIDGEGEGAEIPEDVRAMAYQSVRELLANVQKHSEAKQVNITINHVEDFLTLLVEDDGVGFSNIERDGDERFSGERGFGLFSIRERLRSVNGRMLVDSHPGKGCRIFLSFPADSNSQELI